MAPNHNGFLIYAKGFQPDLLLLDISMPGISGYEVCRSIRQNHEFMYLRIILVSAGALVEEDVKTLEKLNEGGINNEAIKYFLLSRIPNLGKIVAEELTSP